MIWADASSVRHWLTSIEIDMRWRTLLATLAAIGLIAYGFSFPAVSSRPQQRRLPRMEAISFQCHIQESANVAQERIQVLSNDGAVVLKAEGPEYKRTVRLYDAEKGIPIGPTIAMQEPGGSYRLTALAIAQDNQTVATAVGNFSNDWGKVTVWNALNGQLLAEYQGPPYLGEVYDLSFNETGKVVAIECNSAGGK